MIGNELQHLAEITDGLVAFALLMIREAAVIIRLRGYYARALVDFNVALRLDPRFAGAYYNRATVYFFNEDYARALDDFLRARSLGYDVDPSRIEACRRGAASAK